MQPVLETASDGSRDILRKAATVDRPLRVVCLYPTFDLDLNELAIVWRHLAALGAVDCRVIAGSVDTLKGAVSGTLRTELPGLSIRRVQGSIMKGKLPQELIEWAVEHAPDVVVSGEPIAHLGQAVRKATNAALVLHTEFWSDYRVLLPRRYHLGIPALRRPVHKVIRSWMGWHTSKVMVACPVEGRSIKSKSDLRMYVPWPHPALTGRNKDNHQPSEHEARNEIVCIGSVARWKGSEVLVRYVAKVLEQLEDVHVRIIGPAIDRSSEAALQSLAHWKGRCTLVKHLGREEALKAIGRSLCVFNPIEFKGWGSIGDAWNMGVPVVSVVEHYELKAGENALIAPTPEAFVTAVQALRKDESLWNRLARAGHKCVASHSTEAVAEKLLIAIRAAVDEHHRKR